MELVDLGYDAPPTLSASPGSFSSSPRCHHVEEYDEMASVVAAALVLLLASAVPGCYEPPTSVFFFYHSPALRCFCVDALLYPGRATTQVRSRSLRQRFLRQQGSCLLSTAAEDEKRMVQSGQQGSPAGQGGAGVVAARTGAPGRGDDL